MRFTLVTLLISLSSLAASQSLLDQLPQCARTCVGQNFGGCKTLDIACICGNADLISNLSCCVSKSCSAADTNTTIQFAAALCKTYNIIVPTVASCASTASATSAPSGSASAANALTASESSSAASGISSAVNGPAASESSSAASAISSAASLATAPLPAATATSSNIAVVNNIGSGIGMGAAIAGLLAVL